MLISSGLLRLPRVLVCVSVRMCVCVCLDCLSTREVKPGWHLLHCVCYYVWVCTNVCEWVTLGPHRLSTVSCVCVLVYMCVCPPGYLSTGYISTCEPFRGLPSSVSSWHTAPAPSFAFQLHQTTDFTYLFLHLYKMFGFFLFVFFILIDLFVLQIVLTGVTNGA